MVGGGGEEGREGEREGRRGERGQRGERGERGRGWEGGEGGEEGKETGRDSPQTAGVGLRARRRPWGVLAGPPLNDALPHARDRLSVSHVGLT
eukprot:391727-Rhodomonas_salina.4